MNITDFKECLPYLFKAKITPFVWGHHGIGKSSAPRQWTNENGWLMFDYRLNTQSDIGDTIGLQNFVKDKNGNPYAVNHFKPQWLHDSIAFCEANPDKGAVVFFDELNRAARYDMVGPIFQMSIDGRLHVWEFPKNLHIIIASNPSTEDYQVLNLDDKALMDRFCHIKLEPTQKEFFDYARVTGVDHSIVDFLLEQPKFIEDTEGQDFSLDSIAKPSRRTWIDFVNRLVKVGTPKKLLRQLLLGLVGTEAATCYIKSLEVQDKPLSVTDVLENYDKQEIKDRVQRFINSKTGERVDLFKVTLDNLFDHLKKMSGPIDHIHGNNLTDFMLDVPADTGVKFLRDAFVLPACEDYFSSVKYRRADIVKKFKYRTTKSKEVTEQQ